jgi:hypothetical protein
LVNPQEAKDAKLLNAAGSDKKARTLKRRLRVNKNKQSAKSRKKSSAHNLDDSSADLVQSKFTAKSLKKVEKSRRNGRAKTKKSSKILSDSNLSIKVKNKKKIKTSKR